MAKIQKTVDGALLNHQDEREKIIAAIKEENKSQKMFEEAHQIFGDKSWEKDWSRIYQYAATGGYLGNLISIMLGLSGGVFLCYQLTSNWAAAIAIGVVVVLIMEVTKSVSLREATIHTLKGNQMSAMVLASIAISMIIASAYFSVESGMKTPYFQKWVQSEAETVPQANALTTNEYAEKIADLRTEMRGIDREREEYAQKNKTKSTKWLKSDRYESIKAEITYLQKEAATNTAESKQSQSKTIEAATATTLSWWYWCIVILSELCVVFGYCFRPYYLYRCRELAIVDGREINQQDLLVSNNATAYTTIQQQPTNDQLLAEIERLKASQNNASPNPLPNIPVSRLRKIGFNASVNTVNTPVNTVNTDVNTVNTAYLLPVNDDASDDMLLAAFRSSNAQVKARSGRTSDRAVMQIAFHEERMSYIQEILHAREKIIILDDAKRAFIIVPLKNGYNE